jgi:hypothetical protein
MPGGLTTSAVESRTEMPFKQGQAVESDARIDRLLAQD